MESPETKLIEVTTIQAILRTNKHNVKALADNLKGGCRTNINLIIKHNREHFVTGSKRDGYILFLCARKEQQK